ncbi:hypothetical protein SCHPADRAFT_890573 [Schizopora paradoxa]|uniref:Uncharacterized protein n=1 Tax=Schizopora paradoxa TaxID=27342 RepID=A0A0H2RM52_9AGAM|nr:hypothetical protein SCHPADRAFT_890573 [Schizopora paradoxa]
MFKEGKMELTYAICNNHWRADRMGAVGQQQQQEVKENHSSPTRETKAKKCERGSVKMVGQGRHGSKKKPKSNKELAAHEHTYNNCSEHGAKQGQQGPREKLFARQWVRGEREKRAAGQGRTVDPARLTSSSVREHTRDIYSLSRAGHPERAQRPGKSPNISSTRLPKTEASGQIS